MTIHAHFSSGKVSSNTVEAFSLLEKQQFGERSGDEVMYSLHEALYLFEEKKLQLFDGKHTLLSRKEVEKKFLKKDSNFLKTYPVFHDLRKKGYVVKSALKFGAEFRVYDKGKFKDHSRWIVFPLNASEKVSMQDFAAKNRVAHSTKKNLLMAIVDEERQVTYYEVQWIKP